MKKSTMATDDKTKTKEKELTKLLDKKFGKDFTSSSKWQLNCIGGFNDIDLNEVLTRGCKELDNFLKKVEAEAKITQRKPMLCWKKDRKPWIAFIHKNELPDNLTTEYSLTYGKWIGVALQEFLELEDKFWKNN